MSLLLTFRHGEEIDQREAGVSILRRYWKQFAPRDVSEWDQRIANSGHYIVAAYVGDGACRVFLHFLSWCATSWACSFDALSFFRPTLQSRSALAAENLICANNSGSISDGVPDLSLSAR